MSIAVSGSHRTGKTTLVADLLDALPHIVGVDEPYRLLEDEGYVFAANPSLEDFQRQLERSIEAVRDGGRDIVFDRCPADILAYLTLHDDADGFDLDHWLPSLRDTMRQLDLVVFVPIEFPDRVNAVDPESSDLRLRVDEELRSILIDDRWDLEVPVIEVTGAPRDRIDRVLEHLTEWGVVA